MGEDNERVFCELLGLSEAEYARYVDAGAIEVSENQEAESSPA